MHPRWWVAVGLGGVVAVSGIGCATALSPLELENEPDSSTSSTSSGGGSGGNGTGGAGGGVGGAGHGGGAPHFEVGGGGASTGVAGAGGVAASGGTGGSDAGDAGSNGGCSDTTGCSIDDPNPVTRCTGSSVASPIAMPPGTHWASSVVAFSSEWSSPTWAATQATGAPDTYPSYGDIGTAWATQGTDGAGESITLAFSPPATGSMVWIVETYNPDAVSKVTVSTQGGDIVVYQVGAASVGGCAYVLGVPTKTSDPVTQVKIDLASELVAGWNEIDAVGVVP